MKRKLNQREINRIANWVIDETANVFDKIASTGVEIRPSTHLHNLEWEIVAGKKAFKDIMQIPSVVSYDEGRSAEVMIGGFRIKIHSTYAVGDNEWLIWVNKEMFKRIEEIRGRDKARNEITKIIKSGLKGRLR